MSFSKSIFQILCSVRVHGEQQPRVDWSTAFCCEYQGKPELVTTRHTFSHAHLGPELEIYLRGEGEEWNRAAIAISVVVHPVADLCVMLGADGYNRDLLPLEVKTAVTLAPNADLTVRGYPGGWKAQKHLPPLQVGGGRLTAAPSQAAIGRHKLVTLQTDFAGTGGLSGSPIFAEHAVIGIYSRGFDKGVIAVDAGQIAEL